MSNISVKEASQISLDIGRILLESGSTTNKVELTMRKVCASFGFEETESYVTPTGIFLSVYEHDGRLHTSIRRVENRRTDLGRVSRVSRLVHDLEAQHKAEEMPNMTAAEFRAELARIESEQPWPAWFVILCGGLTSGSFCLLFGGSWPEFGVAYIVGVLVSLSLRLLGLLKLNNFLLHLLGAAGVVTFAKLIDIGVPQIRLDTIIIGGIMLLVPGLSFTNAIRDTMSGDLVSGTARAVEALFIAIAIATGSGVMLKLWALWGF